MISPSHIIGALVRRGLETAPQHLAKREDVKRVVFSLPFAAFTVLTLIFIVGLIAIDYTYGRVVTTLTIIEDPNPPAAASLPSYSDVVEDGPKGATIDKKQQQQPLGQPEIEALPTAYKPITSGLRSTTKHLRTRGGPRARFRGFTYYVALTLTRGLLTGLVGFMGAVAPVIADVAVSTMILAWIHAVIAAPSSKSWCQRFPSIRKNWIKIAPAVFISTVASQLSFHVPVAIGAMFGGFRYDGRGMYSLAEPRPIYFAHAGGAVVLSLILGLVLDLPASVMMVRVAASLLPADDETIVPFDRTFNGKVTSVDADGAGLVGILDAWKTFSWASFRRLLMNLVKTCGLIAAACLVYGIVGGVGLKWYFDISISHEDRYPAISQVGFDCRQLQYRAKYQLLLSGWKELYIPSYTFLYYFCITLCTTLPSRSFMPQAHMCISANAVTCSHGVLSNPRVTRQPSTPHTVADRTALLTANLQTVLFPHLSLFCSLSSNPAILTLQVNQRSTYSLHPAYLPRAYGVPNEGNPPPDLLPRHSAPQNQHQNTEAPWKLAIVFFWLSASENQPDRKRKPGEEKKGYQLKKNKSGEEKQSEDGGVGSRRLAEPPAQADADGQGHSGDQLWAGGRQQRV
ncbi:conserved hypothetical protein [Trichophyton verrucosum HKI 0517]|uniref:Ubiquitin conjugating enzyme n=1 Tax=Trichophyton verrucosum (strain HKI 0517) TaxID=663202 RepID=D4D631_TRIVH|nr:uncharacterized protein TRV_02554 [Trichophyton verrucosum HKI 0517]EFE42710.1 conserved hypothetical protein [Trichophyton verrucosum HKI 0517]